MSLYRSPFNTLEFEYHLPGGSERALVGVGLCDVGERTISSVYFYFDPAHHRRSLGTFSALYEIAWAAERNIPHWYAGYWVQGCRTMEYKSRFHPAEALGTDGRWRPLPGEPAEPLV
jgi:arginine-tRNA-protein transferase